MTGAIFEAEDENCLERPASLVTDAGDDEGYGRKESMLEGLWNARVKIRVGRELADCLRKRRGAMDISQGKENHNEKREERQL